MNVAILAATAVVAAVVSYVVANKIPSAAPPSLPQTETKVVIIDNGNRHHNRSHIPPPPERESEYARGALPMTIATNGGPSPFQQVGILKKQDDNPEHDEILLPLFGSKMQSNRDRWRYYTVGAGAGTLPLRVGNRDCFDQNVGCQELYDSDTVTIDGLNGVYNVMMYTVNSRL